MKDNDHNSTLSNISQWNGCSNDAVTGVAPSNVPYGVLQHQGADPTTNASTSSMGLLSGHFTSNVYGRQQMNRLLCRSTHLSAASDKFRTSAFFTSIRCTACNGVFAQYISNQIIGNWSQRVRIDADHPGDTSSPWNFFLSLWSRWCFGS